MPCPPNSNIQLDVIQLIPALKAFARRYYSGTSDIEDLVQDTLLKALSAIGSFTPGTNLKSWLFTIMRNAFNTRYVRQKRFVIGLNDDDTRHCTSPPYQEWAIRAREVTTAIATLPPANRQALLLVALDGKSYEEAAHDLGCQVGTIKSRVFRAREKLALHLGSEVANAVSV